MLQVIATGALSQLPPPITKLANPHLEQPSALTADMGHPDQPQIEPSIEQRNATTAVLPPPDKPPLEPGAPILSVEPVERKPSPRIRGFRLRAPVQRIRPAIDHTTQTLEIRLSQPIQDEEPVQGWEDGQDDQVCVAGDITSQLGRLQKWKESHTLIVDIPHRLAPTTRQG